MGRRDRVGGNAEVQGGHAMTDKAILQDCVDNKCDMVWM